MTAELPSRFPTTSLSLIQQVRLGEQEAWRRFVFLYSDLVYGWARGFRLQNADSADILQEVFQAVHRALPTYHRQDGRTFRSWLWTITLNKTRDLIRVRRLQPLLPGDDVMHDQVLTDPSVAEEQLFPEVASSQGQLLQRAAMLIREDFDPKSWTCFERMVLHANSAAEVARDLQMSTAAVRQAKHRVLKHLRTFCADFL